MEVYWGTQAQEQARGSISSDEGNHEGVVGRGVIVFYFKQIFIKIDDLCVIEDDR